MDHIPFTGEQLTLAGLLGFAIFALMTGWILPRYIYTEAKERIIEEKTAKEDALGANRILSEALLEALRKDDEAHAAVNAIREKGKA